MSGTLTIREELYTLWTVGEDLNWLGKLFIYTAGLPFLCMFTVSTILFHKRPK